MVQSDSDTLARVFGLKECVETRSYDSGRAVYIIRDDEGGEWMVKMVCGCFLPESIEAACEACASWPAVSGFSVPTYRKASTGYVFDDGEACYVCLRFHGEATDLRAVEWEEQRKRIFLARALAALHSSPAVLPVPLCGKWGTRDEHGVWQWIGSARARVKKAMTCGVAEEALAQVDEAGIDELPRGVGTGDCQLKNVLCNVRGVPDSGMLVNVEVAHPISRMWDIIWLVILSDAAIANFSDRTWAHPFAHALQVYKAHVSAEFSPSEIRLFPDLLLIKVLQIAAVFPNDNLLAIARALPAHRELLRGILSAQAPEPSYLPNSPYEALGDVGDIPCPILLHYNGTFSPPHQGHLVAVAGAARAAEQELGGKVVGAMFSPCHPGYAVRKLGKDSLPRVALLNLALSSEAACDIPCKCFVDTFEFLHCHASDRRRITESCERFARMTSGRGLVCMVLGQDSPGAQLQHVNWYLSAHPSVRAVVNLRVGQPAVSPEDLGIDATHADRVILYSSPSSLSSTAIRSAASQDALAKAIGIDPVAAYMASLL
eukprot:Sspe_Gene.67628::Locus_39906_Transcript_2_3_Confidence_0.500_Length_1767::g.67628::m.67628